jgi:uncharacterized protein YgiB involved in biofilm formation
MDSKRPTKRSKRVVLTTLVAAAGAAAVGGCGGGGTDWNDEPAVDAFPYASVAECQSANQVPDSTCQEAYQDALANHEQAAPRYATQPLCEDEFGQNQCQQRLAGGSNYWVPILGGFMVGQALANADLDFDRRKRHYGGLYRSRKSGGWYSGGPSGGPLQRSGSTWRAGASSFDRPTSSPPVRSSSSQSASRGGFGGRSRSSWGG